MRVHSVNDNEKPVLLSPSLDIYATAIYGSELFLWTLMAVIGVVYTVRDRNKAPHATNDEPQLEAGTTAAEQGEIVDSTGQVNQVSTSAVLRRGPTGNVFSRVIRRSGRDPPVMRSTFALRSRSRRQLEGQRDS